MRFLLLFAILSIAASLGATEEEVKKSNSELYNVVGQGSTSDRNRLFEHLFKNGYDKKVNPDNVTLKFGVALIGYNIIEDQELLKSYVWLRESWTDNRLAWDVKEFPVGVLRLDPDLIWKPDVTLYNSADPVHMMSCWQSNVLIYPTGEVLWVPPCKLLSYCHLSIKKHPYGEQTCSLKFGSWTFDGNVMDLQFYESPNFNKFDLSDLQNKTSPYGIVSTTTERNIKHYSCCEEPYPDLTFNITLKRLPAEELLKGY